MIRILDNPVSSYENIDIYTSNQKSYVDNFSKQWKDFKNTQIDSYNKTNITFEHLKKLTFENIDLISNKNILEIGCGSGRYSEYLVKQAKQLFISDYSEAVYFNDVRKNPKVTAIRADLFNMPNFSEKFDVVFCRGVLQHLPDPLEGIKILHSLVNKNGIVIFDIYKKPRLSFLNSKYVWRHIIKLFFDYNTIKKFLEKNIEKILRFRWKINDFFRFNFNYLFDYFFPIYDYRGKLNLSDKALIEWAILDTLDGLFAYYDKPYSVKQITKFLNQNNIQLISMNKNISCYLTSRK